MKRESWHTFARLQKVLGGVPIRTLLGGWLGLNAAYLLAVSLAAGLLGALAGADVVRMLAAALPFDPVYLGLALDMVGSAEEPRLGLALLHEPLSAWWPGLFAYEPGNSGALGLVFSSGTSPVGLWAAHALAGGLFVAVGAVLANAALHSRRPQIAGFPGGRRGLWLLAFGMHALAIGYQVNLLLSDQRAAQVLGPMVVTKLLHAESADVALGPFTLALSLGMHAITFTVMLALSVGAARLAGGLRRRAQRPAGRYYPFWHPGKAGRQAYLAGLALVACVAASPLGSYVTLGSQGLASGDDLQARAGDLRLGRPLRATTADIVQVRDEYWLVVDGRRRVMRGVGYNLPTKQMPPEARTARLHADFQQIRSSGFNVILGWTEAEFDRDLLDVAAANGLGVVAPFHLDPELDYADPRVRTTLLEQIRTWVLKHRDSPALWMWGLGNEVIHAVGDPWSPRSEAFAEFLMDASELIRRLDANHPVLYRDAEDTFFPPVAEALKKRSPRTWFVYGMNFFTQRLGQALAHGPTAELKLPVLVSEFGPAGASASGRPEGYRKQWRAIREHRSRVLGGFAYVWCQRGPEPLDHLFGLTDGNGQPTDGTLEALTAVFREDAAATATP